MFHEHLLENFLRVVFEHVNKSKIKIWYSTFKLYIQYIKLTIMKNKALLVGINKYPDPRNELRGCVNDILDMENYISEKNAIYEKENIRKLTDKDATKKGILQQLQWLIADVAAGDQLLFHYSGHGAQAPTQYPKMEKDGLDEIICPYDFDGSNATTFRDNEFAKLFGHIPKGVHFVWISDSCHAEDLSRDLTTKNEVDSNIKFTEKSYRYFHGIQRPVHTDPAYEMLLDSNAGSETTFNGALLSACASHELSADAIINNRFNGAFTYYLLKNLNQYGSEKSMQTIVSYVNKDLIKYGYDQNPQTEGLLENKTFFI